MHLRRRAVVLGFFAVFALVAVGCLPGAGRQWNGPDANRTIVFKGLGAWWDVYDWSPTFTKGAAPFGLSDVDRLAAAGVQTLYIQPSTFRHPATVLDEPLLRSIIKRAQSRGVRVVGWYLPELKDVSFDVGRMAAIMGLGVNGLGIDIESTANGDVAARTQNLLSEVRFLRLVFPDAAMAAVPVTPVIWEQLNRSWWPNFPYREMAKYFDAWMPMAYWSYRRAGSFPEWGDPYRYTVETVTRLRTLTGKPDLPVHPIGGEAAGMTSADVDAMARAMVDTGSIGGSVYDDNTTPRDLYPSLQQFRRELVK